MWQPLIGPEDRQPYWTAIEDINRALREISEPGGDAMPEDEDPLLSSGTAGLALFFAYFDAARQDTEAGDRAVELLGRSIDAMAQLTLIPGLYGGFCGIGWVVEHLTREFYEAEDDLTGAIAEALRERIDNTPGQLHFELISGLAGFGLYLLERLPRADAEALLGKILDRLEESVQETADGCAWFTPNEWIPPWQRDKLPEGCYNLGVAHGVPGVLGFLAAAQSAGIADPRIPRFADGIVRWLNRHRLPATEDSIFPALAVPGSELEPTRTAWCYGDLGISCVLLIAARVFGRPDWEEEALAAARLATRRELWSVMAGDAGVCHGSSGLGHIFNRMYQMTGDPELKEAALAWYGRTLEKWLPGKGIGGFLTWTGEDPSRMSAQSVAGFLVGSAGVGLALLAAVSDVEPAWDRVLLVSLPKPAAEAVADA